MTGNQFIGHFDSPELSLSFLERPAAFSAWSISHSIWPFTERNSSAAHFSRALYVPSSIRRTKDFLPPDLGGVLAEVPSPCVWLLLIFSLTLKVKLPLQRQGCCILQDSLPNLLSFPQ